MRRSTVAFLALLGFLGLWIAGESLEIGPLSNLAFMTLVAVALVLAYFYLRFEEKGSDTKLVALVATMSALSVGGRCLFAAIPGVQPSTFLIIITGYVYGPLAGFMVGATTALVSNIFLGHGPWTIWQMFAWGLAGLASGLLGRWRLLEGRWRLAWYCAAWGLLFGWIMNAYFVLGFVHPVTTRAFLATYAASAWFDALHAAANFAFAIALGPVMIAMLRRYQARFFFERVAGGATVDAADTEVAGS
ncbi:MAG: ECF transporter S component [Actinomycetota bacterium]